MLHTAPAAFQFPVSRSVRAGFFVCAVCVAVGLVVLAWSWPLWPNGFAWQRLLSLCAMLVWVWGGVYALKQWRNSPSGRLLWQRHVWAWQEASGQQQVLPVIGLDCVWDGQIFILLRLQLPTRRTPTQPVPRCVHWIWLDAAMAPVLWGDMRRAMLFWRQRVLR